ncbi:MAG: SMC-Scp complex subunit ScpB [Thermodesulfobacterium geofontis]|uniref:SMC-Scp complex subunit ScpB n=1 Tax=Thermodesulfobacterium geofontis TaxID=1295609 RepID=A0A2N7PQ82_9BACT|nr:MAG: SMC-Scp complex subunit ScpB [Thermodesulfobacterium geofontis]PMP98032.1 MAG: SMC-Scp complex subunit ScpB [Thermodesulfobacterium geofontis]
MKDQTFYKKVIEALLFCAGRSLKIKEISEICDKIPVSEVKSILEELKNDYSERGIRIAEVAEGYRMETIPEVAEYLKKLLKPKKFRWTKALLETLAIIAYFQPITRAEISAKRGGVDVSNSLKILLENDFIEIVGKKNFPGRPALYGTTKFFLEYFGLKSLKDLPPLEELKKLSD